MVIALNSRLKKVSAAALGLLAAVVYVTLSCRDLLASHFSDSNHTHALQVAVRLVPENADYHHRLAQRLFDEENLPLARDHFRRATYLNPHDADYWLDLAKVERTLDNSSGAAADVQQALRAEPKNPNVAWEAANSFLVQDDKKKALEEFRVVMQGSPNRAYVSLQRCLHVADVQTILAQALPPQPATYLAFLDLLTTQKDSAGAAKTWDALVQLRQPVETERALQYMNYLIDQHEVAQARKVWNETIQLNGLSSYLTGQDNRVVNPSFDAALLNGGFDWRYRRHANVELALDPSDFHAGRRSLMVSFDGPGISDAGIFQLMPLEAETTYEFSAFFKSDNMDGAGGPRLVIQDAYSGTTYFQSDDLKNSEVWRAISGRFQTESTTQLAVLRLIRVPQDSPIRGKLWVDNFRLVETQP